MTDNQYKKEDNSSKKLTDWANEPTIDDLKGDYEEAQSDHSVAVGRINSWLDLFYVKNTAKPKKREGKSEVQPKLIRKQAEWRISSLSEPFLSTEDLFNIKPVTHEDVEAAKQNELVLNHQFNNLIDKERFINEAARVFVSEGTVIIRVGWMNQEETIKEEVPKYEIEHTNDPQVIEMYAQLTADLEAGGEELYLAPQEVQEAYIKSMQEGTYYAPVQKGTVTVERTKTIVNKPTVEVCDYNSVIIDPTCEGDISKANFIIYAYETSMSDLEKAGRYQNLDQINIAEASVLAAADETLEDPGREEVSFRFRDAPRKKLRAYEYWGFRDIDGTGETKPIVGTWVGSTLIELTENPFPDQELPFITAPYLPKKRNIYGEPDAELLEDNQKIVGATTRGMIDIMARTANGQRGMRKGALDLLNRRRFDKGMDYEFNGNGNPGSDFFIETMPNIPTSAEYMINLQHNEAESITGVKAFHSGLSGQALGDTATGIRSALDATSKRELDILRRLANAVKEVGRKIISMNSQFLQETEIVRVTNDEFVPVRRDDLAGKFDLRIGISTAEADNQKAQELAFMLQTTGQHLGPEFSQMILAEIARLRKMPDLARRLEEYKPQPNPLAERKAMLEIELLEAEVLKTRTAAMENESSAILDQAKAGAEVSKSRNLESQARKNDLDFVEQESGVTQERDLQKAGEQARANIELEIAKNALTQNSAAQSPTGEGQP